MTVDPVESAPKPKKPRKKAKPKPLPPVDTFYEHLYRERTKWDGAMIPVRADLAGFLMEGYVSKLTPPEPGVGKRVNFMFAKFPTKSLADIWISTDRLFPSVRQTKRIVDTRIESGYPIDVPNPKWWPLPKQINHAQVIRALRMHREHSWTIPEIASMFGVEPSAVEGFVMDLLEEGTISKELVGAQCLISGIFQDSFNNKKPVAGYIRGETLSDVKNAYENCTECELGCARHERGKSLVFGRGGPAPKLLILGEAPGEREEEMGVPFYPEAPAGSVLRKVMDKAGIPLDECFLTNAVCCRPAPQKAGTVNGTPTTHHIRTCRERLKRTLLAVRPQIVVLLGKVAYESYFGTVPQSMSSVIGWQTHTPIPVYVMYHPSYIVRKLSNLDSSSQQTLKREYLTHWQNVGQELAKLSPAKT